MTESVLLRADAGNKIGAGHLMRLLPLAQHARQQDWTVVLVTVSCPDWIKNQYKAINVCIKRIETNWGSNEDARKTLKIACEFSVDHIILDGYQFDSNYQSLLHKYEGILTVVDDIVSCEEYNCDILLNQNLHASREGYPPDVSDTWFLLGPKFLLLRRELVKSKPEEKKERGQVKQILITLGGGDNRDLLKKIIQALNQIDRSVEVFITCKEPSDLTIEIPKNISFKGSTTAIHKLMGNSDFAIATAGSTAWELAFMGVPSLLIVNADNQIPVAEAVQKFGLGCDLGVADKITVENLTEKINFLMEKDNLRHRMSAEGPRIFDGLGVTRFFTALKARTLEIVEARRDDCKIIWEWANDPQTRSASFDSRPIPWSEHQKWFKKQINNPDHFFYIVTSGGRKLGVVRFELEKNKNTAVISVNLNPMYRGQGLGGSVIFSGCHHFFDNCGNKMQKVHAYIKNDNIISRKVFEKACFDKIKEKIIEGSPAVVMGLSRQDYGFKR